MLRLRPAFRDGQADFASDDLGGWSPGLFAQRSRFSMTSAWLGRRGGGSFCSSDSLRGSLTVSVMGFLQSEHFPARNMRSRKSQINR